MLRLRPWLWRLTWGTSLLLMLVVLAVWVRSYWMVYSVSFALSNRYLLAANTGQLVFDVEKNTWKNLPWLDFGSQRVEESWHWSGTDGGTVMHFVPDCRIFKWFRFDVAPTRHGAYPRISIPMWAPLVLFAAAPSLSLVSFARRHRRQRLARKGCCVRCGYDLRGSRGSCPECGEPISPQFDPAKSSDPLP